jgi:hypothetical protein
MPGHNLSPELRQKRREIALKHKPWQYSTGPRTPEGKKISSTNSLKHGLTSKDPMKRLVGRLLMSEVRFKEVYDALYPLFEEELSKRDA